MAKLTPESAWEFADAIKAIVKPQTTRRKATVQSVDKDGTIWVNLPGSSTVTPIQSTGANVSPGDTVLTELRGTSLHITGNITNPAIGENAARSIARQETAHAEAMAKQAQTIADEANAVAEATNQHFFADDNGAHITDVTQDEWSAAVADEFSDYDPTTKPYHNQLLNSLGILLRTALNNLVSITRSAIAFYDGTGNAASNIVARFGADGAQIGYVDEPHVEISNHSLGLVNNSAEPFYVDLRKTYQDPMSQYAPVSVGLCGAIAGWNVNPAGAYLEAVGSSGAFKAHVFTGDKARIGREDKPHVFLNSSGFTFGTGATAAIDNQTAIGQYNLEDTNGDYALIIGNGTADNARSNALAVTWDGDIECATDTAWITLNGTIKYRIHHGVCYVCGDSVSGGTSAGTSGTTVGTLPTGARPSVTVTGAASTKSNAANGQFSIDSSGIITVWNLSNSSPYWCFAASYPVG